MKREPVVIVGAGLVGALLGTLLAQRGFAVSLFERRPDPRKAGFLGGRSINLALAERGWHGLRAAGLQQRIAPIAVMMRGRMVHHADGHTELLRYGRDDSEVIWSVSRGALNMALLDGAEAAGARIHFDQALRDVDWEKSTLQFSNETGTTHEHVAPLVIGADGAGSALRTAMGKQADLGERFEPLDHGYKELEIPALSASAGTDGPLPPVGTFPRERGKDSNSLRADLRITGERGKDSDSLRSDLPITGERGKDSNSLRSDLPITGERGKDSSSLRSDLPITGEREKDSSSLRSDLPLRRERGEDPNRLHSDSPITGERGKDSDRLRSDLPFPCAAGEGGRRPEGGRFALEPNALHIWPRGNYMCIALPNSEGSFTVTLFMPNTGDPSFVTVDSPTAAHALFARDFADVLPFIPQLEHDFTHNPTGVLGTLYLDRWHLGGRALLLGDAAHALVPFHGQGMNCGFEDAVELAQLLGDSDGDAESAFAEFERQRKPNADAIAAMALENYVEMRDSVADEHFLLMREVGRALAERRPGRFVPRYWMVTFTRMPYATALARGEIQSGILRELCTGKTALDQIDLARADQLIDARLPARVD